MGSGWWWWLMAVALLVLLMVVRVVATGLKLGCLMARFSALRAGRLVR